MKSRFLVQKPGFSAGDFADEIEISRSETRFLAGDFADEIEISRSETRFLGPMPKSYSSGLTFEEKHKIVKLLPKFVKIRYAESGIVQFNT